MGFNYFVIDASLWLQSYTKINRFYKRKQVKLVKVYNGNNSTISCINLTSKWQSCNSKMFRMFFTQQSIKNYINTLIKLDETRISYIWLQGYSKISIKLFIIKEMSININKTIRSFYIFI